jgi:2,3-dihydroxybiphenyl 1,2-dioxygenase
MASVSQLAYLGIGISDPTAWERFATTILGLQISERLEDGGFLLRYDEYHYRIAAHVDGTDNLSYIGWQADDEATLRALADQLTACGTEVRWATPEEAKARRVRELLRFTDPNGWRSEICVGPHVNWSERYQPSRPIAGFVTGDQGLGHIVVGVADFQTSLDFYRDALGLRVSDYVQIERGPGVTQNFVFLHCNPRHHSIAFGSPGTPPGKFNHIMLQVKEIDDLGTTYDLCQAENLEPQGLSRMGRHPNDQMISFYIPTPSGWGIEWGWGARTVHDDNWQVTTYTRMSTWGHQRPARQQAQPQPVAAGARA